MSDSQYAKWTTIKTESGIERTSFMGDTYRYLLEINWDRSLPAAAFFGLNPSKADETRNDPTFLRCIGFARDWGCGSLKMFNVFALKSTDYRGLFATVDPVGPLNTLDFLLTLSAKAKYKVAAWGGHADRKWLHRYRPREIAEAIDGLACLGTITGGHPAHPLYLPKNSSLRAFHYE